MTAHRSPLRVTNTASGVKEVFAPAHDNHVSMYVCGVTPYADAHVGHGRCYVNFDVVYRTLLFLGYTVNYVRNITDVDDKIVKKAHELSDEVGTLEQRAHAVAQRYTKLFEQDMAALQVAIPSEQPTVSGHIAQIISFIEQLIANGNAYAAGGDVYFAVDSLVSYGALSGRKVEDMQAGARVAINQNKRHEADFVLWKGGVDGSFWESPWGPGRPGWHIECSTFAAEYLGKSIDIHGGGQDLIFPHHENEQAQSEACHKVPFVRYWLHNAHVTMNSEKMSKSLGNTRSLREMCEEYDPMVVRFYLLQHHYRTPIDFAGEQVASAGRAYRKLVRTLNAGCADPQGVPEMEPNLRLSEWLATHEGDSLVEQVVDALCDDFNTPKVLGLIFTELDALAAAPERAAAIRLFVQQVLGVTCQEIAEKEVALSPQVQSLIEQRAAARAARDWAEADRLRDELRALGHEPRDGKV